MSNKNVIVVAPHPDDETLGCGGTILLLKEQSYKIFWLITTSISQENGFTKERIKKRQKEIKLVSDTYGFESVINLEIPSTKVGEVAYGSLIQMISKEFNEIKPNILFLPFYNDVHTDHKIIAEACLSCTKWFRYPYIETVLAYETLSETDFNINTCNKKFEPNVFIDISNYLERKIQIMNIYESEMSDFPFPRSDKAIRSLAYLRGSQSGSMAAEAFELQRANVKTSK
ncbi:PIG-L deacetylase family protein [Pelotomaculum propionicicum]|uniref:PIG-L deacetylase family protein n=1 Tax=Pelotomaculum propionicicum TaxID=258475 RepID=UPI003B7ADBB6